MMGNMKFLFIILLMVLPVFGQGSEVVRFPEWTVDAETGIPISDTTAPFYSIEQRSEQYWSKVRHDWRRWLLISGKVSIDTTGWETIKADTAIVVVSRAIPDTMGFTSEERYTVSPVAGSDVLTDTSRYFVDFPILVFPDSLRDTTITVLRRAIRSIPLFDGISVKDFLGAGEDNSNTTISDSQVISTLSSEE